MRRMSAWHAVPNSSGNHCGCHCPGSPVGVPGILTPVCCIPGSLDACLDARPPRGNPLLPPTAAGQRPLHLFLAAPGPQQHAQDKRQSCTSSSLLLRPSHTAHALHLLPRLSPSGSAGEPSCIRASPSVAHSSVPDSCSALLFQVYNCCSQRSCFIPAQIQSTSRDNAMQHLSFFVQDFLVSKCGNQHPSGPALPAPTH